MQRFLYFIAGIFSLFLSLAAAPLENETPVDLKFDKVMTIGLDHIANSRFLEAIALFDSLEKVFPKHPAPNFYIAAAYQTWMLTYRFNYYQDILDKNVNRAIEKGNALAEKDNDPWLNFYIGASYGFKALHLFRQHNWISAYFAGSDGIDNFNTALEKMPNLYDAYYGIGAYNYWRTAKSSFIRFIAFWIPDNRELGIEQFNLSIEKGRYCTFEAMNGLIMVYYHHGDYAKALDLNSSALQLSEIKSLSTLYMRGRIYEKLGEWESSQDIFQRILDELILQPHKSISYMVECKYWIAKALANQNRKQEAYKLVTDALIQSKDWNKDNELENPFEDFEIIVEWLEELKEVLENNLAEKTLLQ